MRACVCVKGASMVHAFVLLYYKQIKTQARSCLLKLFLILGLQEAVFTTQSQDGGIASHW